VRRLAPPLARGGGGSVSGSPMRSSASGGGLTAYSAMQRAGCIEHSPYAPPTRAGGSFSSRLQSGFLSLLSSRDGGRGRGLTSQQLAGMGGNVQSREGSFSSLASSSHYRRH
jgi:hypothetical protein